MKKLICIISQVAVSFNNSVLLGILFLGVYTNLQAQVETYDVDRTYGTSCGVTAISSIGGYTVNPVSGCCAGRAKASFIYSDDSVVSVYEVHTPPSGSNFGIGLLKLDVNGQPVTSFGTGGTTFFSPGEHCSPNIHSVDSGANGKIFVVGFISPNNCPGGGPYIACFNADGSLNYLTIETDNCGFCPNSPQSFYSAVYFGVVVQTDGKAVVWGAKTYVGSSGFGINRYLSRRYNTDGTADNTFNPGLSYDSVDPPIGIIKIQQGRGILQSDGKVVFCYHAFPDVSGGNDELYLTRLNTDGTLDNTFGTGSYTPSDFRGACADVNSSSDVNGFGFRKISGDKMRIGSTLTTCPGAPANINGKVLQLTANGLPDNSYGTSGAITLHYSTHQTDIRDIVVDPATDKTYAIGSGGGGGLIFRINSNGTLDNTFNGTGLRAFNGFYNGVFCGSFQRAGLYSSHRILLSFDNSSVPGVVHSVIDISNSQLSITATPECPNVILTVDDLNLACFTWQWYKDGALILGATGTSYTATLSGNYHVTGSFVPPPTNPPGLPPGSTSSNVLSVITGAPIWYLDADGDQYYSGSPVSQCSSPGIGYTMESLIGGNDCDDENAAINPAATEICNDMDDDCDGLTDDDDADIMGQSLWYADIDDDGFGDIASSMFACDQPSDYVSDSTDCNDGDDAIHPDAIEVCNDVDDDCDGLIDDDDPELEGQLSWYLDNDGDGFGDSGQLLLLCNQPTGYVPNGDDCNDADTMINPIATEICDGIDNDCDNLTDDADPDIVGQVSWYQDGDGDGFGNPGVVAIACFQPANHTGSGTDCDDTNAGNNPDATEILDGEDNDCDGLIDEGLSAISIDAGDCVIVYNGYAPAECTVLTVTVQGGVLPYTYLWSNGANTASTTVCPEETIIYEVIVTDYNGNSAQDVVTVQVFDISCGNNKVTVCHLPPGNPENVQTICISVNAVATHLAEHGDYLGVCSIQDPCDGTNQSQNMTAIVNSHLEESNDRFNELSYDSISENSKLIEGGSSNINKIQVYPNPTNGRIIVILPGRIKEGTLNVLSLYGQGLFSQQVVRDQRLELDLSAYAEGLYLIDVQCVDGHYQKKMVKL